jgi:hypothetical protein
MQSEPLLDHEPPAELTPLMRSPGSELESQAAGLGSLRKQQQSLQRGLSESQFTLQVQNADPGTRFSAHFEAFAANFHGLSALEIAAVVGAKKFLSQAAVQRLIGKIWTGEIVFWERLDVDSVKQPKLYSPRSVPSLLRPGAWSPANPRIQTSGSFLPASSTAVSQVF